MSPSKRPRTGDDPGEISQERPGKALGSVASALFASWSCSATSTPSTPPRDRSRRECAAAELMFRDSSPTDSTTITIFDQGSDDSTCKAEMGELRACRGTCVTHTPGGSRPAQSDFNALLDLVGGTSSALQATRDGTPDPINATPPATPDKPLGCNPICYGFFSPQNVPVTNPACFPACLALTLPLRKVKSAPFEGPGILKDAINP
jgi:hypothetical protein